MTVIRKFLTGRSGSSVSLIEYNGHAAVYKENLRNVECILKIGYDIGLPTPAIYDYTDSTITMEYINGISIKTYLATADKKDVHRLIDYISYYFDFAIARSSIREFRPFMEQKIKTLEPYGVDIPLVETSLLGGLVHGDFTFDNLLYSNGKFVMIDLTPSEHNGIHFDANKMRQDLSGHWFIRNEVTPTNIKLSCRIIYDELQKQYPQLFDDNLYKFMFARVLPYCHDETERNFIRNALCRL